MNQYIWRIIPILQKNSYLWAYKVKIKNNSEETVKLVSRHWKIFDSNGNHREVRGKGVVGEQPIIQPGDEFEYTSGTPLKTSSGMMHGSYQMQDYKGQERLRFLFHHSLWMFQIMKKN